MAHERSAGNSRRLEYLDSIRGLAALSVVWSHFVLAYGLPTSQSAIRNALENSPLHIWWDGAAAVSMFFVLSGFVLSIKHFQKVNGSFKELRLELVAYTVSRFCRISLPYLACMALVLFSVKYFYTAEATVPSRSDWALGFWQPGLSLKQLVREASLLLRVENYTIIPQAWTLSVELLLSLLIPVAIVVARRNTLWLLFFVALSVAFLRIPVYSVHFALGLLLAKHLTELATWLTSLNKGLRIGFLLAALFFYTFRFSVPTFLPGVFRDELIYLVTGLGSAMILLFVLSSEVSQQWLMRPLLKWMGRISYSVYLCHFIAILCITPWLLRWLQGAGIQNVWLCWWIGFIASTLCTLGISTLLYAWIERPSIELGRRLARFFSGRVDGEKAPALQPEKPESESRPVLEQTTMYR